MARRLPYPRAVLAWGFLCLAGPVHAECVALLHGLARGSTSMLVLDLQLQRAGFETVRLDYPSTDLPLPALAEAVVPEALARCSADGKVHFVTHSMGGILVRYAFRETVPERVGRVVMLGPPNKGSEIVDRLRDLPGFELWNGPAGVMLGTDAQSWPNRLGPAKFELGVIAGTQSISPYFSTLIPGVDDGKVSVDSTRLEGMDDHISLHVTHTFMMNAPEVARQVIAFLRDGAFAR